MNTMWNRVKLIFKNWRDYDLLKARVSVLESEILLHKCINDQIKNSFDDEIKYKEIVNKNKTRDFFVLSEMLLDKIDKVQFLNEEIEKLQKRNKLQEQLESANKIKRTKPDTKSVVNAPTKRKRKAYVRKVPLRDDRASDKA